MILSDLISKTNVVIDVSKILRSKKFYRNFANAKSYSVINVSKNHSGNFTSCYCDFVLLAF